jgi:hypothetical protein
MIIKYTKIKEYLKDKEVKDKVLKIYSRYLRFYKLQGAPVDILTRIMNNILHKKYQKKFNCIY